MDNKGFLLLEVLLAVATLSVVLIFSYIVSTYSTQYILSNLNYTKADILAKEGIEAVLSAKENNFSQFDDGSYGIYSTSSSWFLSPSPNVIDSSFTRTISVTSVDDNRKNVISSVTWQNPYSTVNNNVSYSQYITNWRPTENLICDLQNNFFELDSSDKALANNNREIVGLKIRNTSTNCNIIVDKVTLTWQGNPRIREVNFEGTVVWDNGNIGNPNGAQQSGTELDIVNYTLLSGNVFIDIDRLRFTTRINNNNITIVFTFSDSTTKNYSFSI